MEKIWNPEEEPGAERKPRWRIGRYGGATIYS